MKLIILDFDGPINNQIEAKREALQKTAEELSIELTEKNIWEIVNYIDQIYETEKIYDYAEIINKSLAKLVSNNSLNLNNETVDKFATIFSEKMQNIVHLSRDVEIFIKEARRKNADLNVCIYSTQIESEIKRLLNISGIDRNLFDRIYDRNYFEEPKPSTVNFEKILEDFHVEPREVVMVGDNVAVDLAPAKMLGIKTVLLNQFVDLTVNDISELKSLTEKEN